MTAAPNSRMNLTALRAARCPARYPAKRSSEKPRCTRTGLAAYRTDPVHIDAEMPPSPCPTVVKRTVDSGIGWRTSMET